MKHECHANTGNYGDNQPNILQMERGPEAEAYATSNQERRAVTGGGKNGVLHGQFSVEAISAKAD